MHSPEARDHLVQSWYASFLGRQSSNGEEQGSVTRVPEGYSDQQVLAAILGSAEFYDHAQTLALAGVGEDHFIEALYRMLLGCTPNANEVAAWRNALPQLGMQGVAFYVLELRRVPYRSGRGRLRTRPPDWPGDRAGLRPVEFVFAQPGRHPHQHRIEPRVLREWVIFDSGPGMNPALPRWRQQVPCLSSCPNMLGPPYSVVDDFGLLVHNFRQVADDNLFLAREIGPGSLLRFLATSIHLSSLMPVCTGVWTALPSSYK